MKNTIYKMTFTVATVVLSLTSCIKDDLFNTPHPDKGAIVVAADWTERSESCAIPSEYTLYHTCCAAADPCTMPGDGEKCHPTLFDEGQHTLVAHNTADKIAVSGTTATVATLAENKASGRAVGTIDPMPGYLLTASHEITTAKDDTVRVTLPMRQRVRNLRIELTVAGGNPEQIQSVTGTLSGIAGSFDLAAQKPVGEAVFTVVAFVRNADKLTADARLLGTTGDRQTLSISITFADGRTQTTESDLTDCLKEFGSDMTNAFVLTNNLNLPVGAGMEATIEEWQPGNGGGEDVEIQ